ncbi:MAG: phage tail tube protein [Veillonellales bacterium]
MSQAMGVYGKTTIDYETTFGVSPTTVAGKTLPFITNQLNSKQNLNTSKVISGVRSDSQPAYGNTDVSGTITTPVDLGSIGYWLKPVIGAPVTTVNAAGAATDFTHVFKVGTSLPSMLIERLVGANYFLYHGCKADTFKVSIGGDSELEAQIDYVGCKSIVGTTPYDAAATLIKQINKLNQFGAAIKIGGSAVTGTIKSGDFTINNNLDKDGYTIGDNGFRSQVAEGSAQVSGTFKALFNDTTLLNYGINQTITSLEILWNLSATKSLSFLFPEVNFSRTDALITGPGGVEIDLSWQGFWQSDAGNSAVIATLNNQVASY